MNSISGPRLGKAIALLLVLFLPSACDVEGKSKSVPRDEAPSVYFKLASLQEQSSTPSASLIADYRAALDKLQKKCPSHTHDELGNFAYFMHKELAKKGQHETTLACIDLMEKSIPDGQTMAKCDEIAAALIVLTNGK